MRLSVCLAAYNGSKFIREQIASICIQLGADDELLVGDDCSSDDTVSIVKSFDDPRVHVYESKTNMGHVKNFERLISFASGDVIFLSDQDDIWEIEKADKIKNILSAHPEVTLVHHALSLMDENGVVYQNHWKHFIEGCPSRSNVLIRQLLRAEMFGCAIAFRASIRKYILPFPANVYAHDHWLGLVNGLFGKTYYLNMPLVRYRQHANNLTPKKGLSYFKKAKFRLIQLHNAVHLLFKILPTKMR